MLNSNIKKFLIILLLVFSFVKVDAIVDATRNYYVNDYANALTEETKEYLYNRSIALDDASKIQVVVTTVESLEGLSIEDYANKLYNKLEIGEDSKGVLILLCPKERLIRIEIGDGLGGILPDGKVGRILDDYAIPSLKNDSWNEGIKNAYDALYQTIVEEYNLNIDYTVPSRPYNSLNAFVYGIFGFLFGLFFGTIVNTVILGGSKKGISLVLYIIAIVFGFSYGYINKISDLMYFCSFQNVFGYALSLLSSGHSSSNRRYRRSYSSYSSYSSGGSSSFGGHGGHSSGGGASRGF